MTVGALVLILFLISAIACAWFATSRNRNQAGWFLLGCLTGPIAILLLLLLPPLAASKQRPAVGRAIAGALIVTLIAVALGAGAAEFWERYQAGERDVVLKDWEMYGDALLRYTKSGEDPAESIVVKAAVSQIDDYERRLREGMCWTVDDLELAVQGVRNSTGARAVLENAKRLVTLQPTAWPVKLPMDTRDQGTRIEELTARMRQYEAAIEKIHTARSDTAAVTSTN